MFQSSLKEQVRLVRSSIVAIGFHPDPSRITIIGSGFHIGEGKIIVAAHLYNHLDGNQKNKLRANVMIEQQLDKEFERYEWKDIELVAKDDKNDLAVFQLKDYQFDVLKELGNVKLELGDSDKVEVGQDVYFIGFPYAAKLINDGFGVTLITNRGIISNVKRDGSDPKRARNWFIVDAISNPGNSGCPLIDTETNKVIGVMTIAFRSKSQVIDNLDIREPMHIAGARPINLVKSLLN